jgi:hypothetical protein
MTDQERASLRASADHIRRALDEAG